uniref:N/A n=1 Tax=Ganoderma boninense TaxID=34458 RepID=A0A5K1JYP4_9APHY|nr:N/A [Ganoderma boninense]
MLSVPDLFGLGRSRSGGSSGSSTPKRISFIEPPEPYSSSKPDGSSSKLFPTRSRSKSSGKGKDRRRDPKGKGKGKAQTDENDGGNVGWWTGWLLGAAGAESGHGLGVGVGHTPAEERYAFANPSARGGGVVGTWSMRHGYGGSLEEWGA